MPGLANRSTDINPLLPKVEVVTTDSIVLVQYEFQVDQTAYCGVQLVL